MKTRYPIEEQRLAKMQEYAIMREAIKDGFAAAIIAALLYGAIRMAFGI